MTSLREEPEGYHSLLEDLKGRVQLSQLRAALAAGKELVLLYWGIGRDISIRLSAEGFSSAPMSSILAFEIIADPSPQ